MVNMLGGSGKSQLDVKNLQVAQNIFSWNVSIFSWLRVQFTAWLLWATVKFENPKEKRSEIPSLSAEFLEESQLRGFSLLSVILSYP
jgi:hypothetical protein